MTPNEWLLDETRKWVQPARKERPGTGIARRTSTARWRFEGGFQSRVDQGACRGIQVIFLS
jgi:hypothetical protein